MRGDAAVVPLLPGNAEVTELQAMPLADEHVHGREIAVEHLSAMQRAKHLEDARDLTACGGLTPPFRRPREGRAEIPVARVLQREAIEHPPVGAHQREGVVQAQGARMILQQLAEVRLPHPAVDMRADLHPHDLGHAPGGSQPGGQVHVSKTALTQQAADPIAQAGVGADDHLGGHEVVLIA